MSPFGNPGRGHFFVHVTFERSLHMLLLSEKKLLLWPTQYFNFKLIYREKSAKTLYPSFFYGAFICL